MKKILTVLMLSVAIAAHGANAWMQNARKSPKWFTDGVMYQIQPRAFTPEGTLKAAEKKLPYLKDLGVTIVYLVPVMKMDASMDKSFWSPRQIRSGFNNPKNQYRIADFFHVDEEYGTDQDLKDFVAAAHALGMKVMFDLVYFHCGPTAPFLKEHPEFTWWNEDGSIKKGPWRFPKLNFAEPTLRKYLIGNIRYLMMEYGADGFRCDVGDGIPLDFWCDAHDMMDEVSKSDAVLLCEGFTVCNQYKGFDADYGWFPALNAQTVRSAWIDREKQCPVGSKFVNHYENHDVATDERPRREKRWGRLAVDQVMAWMFTVDGVPMLFCGNELADADERHSMFGKTPMDWSQLDREPGKSRHALVKELAALRRAHPSFTVVNGKDGLTWLTTSAPDAVSAFVRRGGGETILVVQNWTDKSIDCEIDFTAPTESLPSYIAMEKVDRDVKGTIEAKPLHAYDARLIEGRRFTLGPWGRWIGRITPEAFALDQSVMSEKYWQVWNDDVQKRIDADIEKYRKADASAQVAAPDGTEVSVEQISHAFFFGAHIFNFNQLGTKERNDRYKELYGTLFNSATVAFYWRTLEMHPYAPRFEERYEDTESFWNNCLEPAREPHWRRPAVDPVISFLKTRGVRIHGHPLVWGNNEWHTPTWLWDEFCPATEKFALEQATGIKIPTRSITEPICTKSLGWVREREWQAAWRKIFSKLSEDEIAALIPSYVNAINTLYEARVRAIAERYGNRVDSWDVVNESATDFHTFGRHAVRGKAFDKSRYGPMPADYAFKSFEWVQKYFPAKAWLNINDYNMDPFLAQVEDLVKNGARIDVVGSQMHLFNPKESAALARGEFTRETHKKTHPEGVWNTFATLAQAKRPIHLSEITITAPDKTSRGEMVQAIIIRNLYRLWFSIERMNGITWWNVVDDCGAPGEPSMSGLFTRDMKPKTAYYAMDDLINREWKTRLKVKALDSKVAFRGFRGKYRLSWTDDKGATQTKLIEVK